LILSFNVPIAAWRFYPALHRESISYARLKAFNLHQPINQLSHRIQDRARQPAIQLTKESSCDSKREAQSIQVAWAFKESAASLNFKLAD
jgi:hypothetical protein